MLFFMCCFVGVSRSESSTTRPKAVPAADSSSGLSPKPGTQDGPHDLSRSTSSLLPESLSARFALYVGNRSTREGLGVQGFRGFGV